MVNSGQNTDEILRDTLIENEKWNIYSDGSIYTNRNGELYYPVTTITCSIPKQSYVELKIYDMSGRRDDKCMFI